MDNTIPTMPMDNRLTIHERIDMHLRRLDYYKLEFNYQQWYYTLCSLYDTIYAKITKRQRSSSETLIRALTKASDIEISKDNKSLDKKLKKAKKRNYDKEYKIIQNNFRKLSTSKAVYSTYLQKTRNPLAHTKLIDFLSEFQRWLEKIMEKHGIYGMVQNEW